MSSTVQWPPSDITTTRQIIPSYLYRQYADDQDLQALVDAYNQLAQEYLDWFNDTPLGVYTNDNISGSLLDWVAEGLYGIIRPVLEYGSTSLVGPLDTWAPDTPGITLAQSIMSGGITIFGVTDDIFKRIITWHFFKGDGQQFSILWLKRRIMRFLIGINGTAPNIDQTNQVSVTFTNPTSVDIVIDVSGPVTLTVATIFQAAVHSAAVELPFQFTWTVNLGGLSSLASDGGILEFVGPNSAPTTSGGAPGSIWSNGGVASVVPGYVPGGPVAVFLGVITAAQLLLMGGTDLPISDPHVLNELYVLADEILVSAG